MLILLWGVFQLVVSVPGPCLGSVLAPGSFFVRSISVIIEINLFTLWHSKKKRCRTQAFLLSVELTDFTFVVEKLLPQHKGCGLETFILHVVVPSGPCVCT